MREYKKVTRKHLRKGQEINGYESSNSRSAFTAFVKEVTPAYVLVEKWRRGGAEERLDPEALFLVQMSEEEFRSKYNSKASEVVAAIQKKLYRDEIGYHEIWNGWLSANPWELASECIRNKLNILGHCEAITPKQTMFTGDILGIGICVEDEDGDKFWCHFSKDDMEIMIERYRKYQEYMKAGRTKEFDEFEVEWEYREKKAKLEETKCR